MAYRIGVDLGTTYSAAAVIDRTTPLMVGLADHAMQIPSALFLTQDGSFIVGESAVRSGRAQPDRLVREFKRRFGDPVPLLVGGIPYSAERLSAQLLQWIVSEITKRRGEAPVDVMSTYPANWGPYKQELLGQVVALAGLTSAQFCTEPEAAAVHYATKSKIAVGDRIAVYDLGGGTFDVCIMEKSGDHFSIVGSAAGLEHLGGSDVDEAVADLVLRVIGPQLSVVDLDDPAMKIGLARLRRDCVDAKEALSIDTDVTVMVSLPGLNTSVRIQRSELEAAIRPVLQETVAAVDRTLSLAEMAPHELKAIVLIGGSSRIPLVTEMLQNAFPQVKLSMDTHPKHDVALGAALLSASRSAAATPVPGQEGSSGRRREGRRPSPPPRERSRERRPDRAPSSTPRPTEQSEKGVRRVEPQAKLADHAGRDRRDFLVTHKRSLIVGAASVLLIGAAIVAFAITPDRPRVVAQPAPPSSVPACGFDESFDTDQLDPAWRRTGPDAKLEIRGGAAELTAPDGADIYEEKVTAPMILRTATGDFVLDAEVSVSPHQFYQGAGLVVLGGADRYVRFEQGYVQFRGLLFEYKDGGPHRFISSPRTGRDPVVTGTDRLTLRLVRDGELLTAWWQPSNSGPFQRVGSIKVTFGEKVDVGLSVLNSAQNQSVPEDFEATFTRVSMQC